MIKNQIRKEMQMKKLILVLVLSAFAMSLFISGQEAMAAEKTFNLKYNYYGPEVIPPGVWAKNAAQRIEEKSGGRIKIKCFFSESLLKYDTAITGTASGVSDITFVDPGTFAGVFELNLVFTKMIMDVPSKEAMTKTFMEMIKTNPAFNKELEAKGLRWLSIFAMPGFHMHTTNSPIKTPADMEGKKISTMGKDPSMWMESLKCAPVPLAPGDWYMSLSRGLVDGIFLHFAAIDGFKLADVFKYHTVLGENGAQPSFCGYVISLKTWNKLPKDLQDILIEGFDYGSNGTVDALTAEIDRGINACKEHGNTFIKLTPDEIQQWANTMKPITDRWVEETEALGLPAKEAFNQLMSLFAKYR
jgi:TRAP-type C4-dicarboxylate transport system substrate-binding protein